MKNRKPNRLIYEKSPYLLQHAYNPVDWFPWCDEAFEKAAAENKPIFLSIGYSTCHWCHVMEKESFEDTEVAELLNNYFVPIKVDREERPDIDLIYMHYCTEITGSGGWPLSCFLTPNKKPFFVGTYYPKYTTNQYLGFIDLLKKIITIWQENSSLLIDASDELMEKIKKNYFNKTETTPLDSNIDETTFYSLLRHFDRENGGFGSNPKFPIPHNLFFLLRYYKNSKQTTPLDMVRLTLKKMRCGGIFDQIGYGFHRYSTDEKWLLPHFEKMLYDQALLCIAYLETYQATGEIFFLKTALEIIQYVENNLLAENGMFYSAEDADSEGMEGKFYLWTEEEIYNTLGEDEYVQIFNKFYNIKKNGNFTFETGHTNNSYNILHSNHPLEDLAESYDGKFFINKFEEYRKILLEKRNQRPRPFRDEKNLVDWNALMIIALAKAYKLTANKNIYELASKSANFIISHLLTPEKLLHSFKEESSQTEGFLNDYAFLAWAMIELYEINGEQLYLEKALSLTNMIIEKFWNSEVKAFNFCSNLHQTILFDMQEFYDGAIPSGNSVAYGVLNKLYNITHKEIYNEYANQLEASYLEKTHQAPSAYTNFLSNYLEKKAGYLSIAIVTGDDEKEFEETKFILNNHFIPNKTIIIINENNREFLSNFSPIYSEMKAINGKTTIYICKNFTCQAPINEIEELKTALSEI